MTLRGHTVLVTRPAEQAEPLCAAIESAGGQVQRLPLLRIEACAPTEILRQQLGSPHDAVLFTSVNAVRHALTIQPDPRHWPARTAAIGAATAAAIRAAGLPAAIQPASEYSTEGLLAHPDFQQLGGQRLLLVTGRGGREMLEDTLRARGADVTRAEVYERLPQSQAEATVRGALQDCDVAVVTSGETLRQLLAVTPTDMQPSLRRLKLVVPGERVLQMARAHGFAGRMECPQPMSDTGILRALMRLAE